jgi:hypothetical protein
MALKQISNGGNVPPPRIQQQHVGTVTGSMGYALSLAQFVEDSRFLVCQRNPEGSSNSQYGETLFRPWERQYCDDI